MSASVLIKLAPYIALVLIGVGSVFFCFKYGYGLGYDARSLEYKELQEQVLKDNADEVQKVREKEKIIYKYIKTQPASDGRCPNQLDAIERVYKELGVK